ncbi:hypothetical protein H0H93_013905 [Arthromyces matolae]|nr:hypothetical protein H0H93_013905 [Arthromyces matolae]
MHRALSSSTKYITVLQSTAMTRKDIVVIVDNTTIKKDIKLVFSFKELTSVDAQRVAYKLAFSLASKDYKHVVRPGQLVKLDGLQKTVQIKVGKDGYLELQNPTDSKTLAEGQISVENASDREAAVVAVGFLKRNSFNTAGYIGGLMNNTSWIVTYKPDLTLYISSDGVTGQTFDSISFFTQAVHTWPLGNDSEVPNNSRWVLYQDQTYTYRIQREEQE